ncbi:MAG: ABC transporter permease [Lentisphaeria bacterium]|nr:ABC transporter permease [Lentisphaeria bacterium]
MLKRTVKNIYCLGVKELISLFRDYLLLILIVYSFSAAIVVASRGKPDSLKSAAIAVVDEDHSRLSRKIADAFFPPMFIPAKEIPRNMIDREMDTGAYTFVLVIPVNFERDLLAGRDPEIQLNVDATRMAQAFTGAGYIQQIINGEVNDYLQIKDTDSLARTVIRNRFNPNLTQGWFEAAVQLVNNITMLAIILTGAALIKERENGTLEHLLVMPVNAFEIMASKIWSMMAVVLFAATLSVIFVVHIFLAVPIEGSILLFVVGVALHLFAATSLGIFLACIAQNMPQLGMLLILILLPLQMLSGGMTPKESMPEWIQHVMQIAPTTHFVEFSQAILYRGAGLSVVWLPFLKLLIIGGILFLISLSRFRKSVA